MITTAENLGISIYFFPIANKPAFVADNKIVLDERKIETRRKLNEIIAHEIGHIETGSIYAFSYAASPLKKRAISRAERKANVYAYQLLVPLERLKTEAKIASDDYEIAEALDVDINTLHNAVDFYRGRGMI